jgi:hypothetical protein
MITRLVMLGSLAASVVGIAVRHSSTSDADATVQLNVGTIHAAALSSPRSDADALDAPYVLISIAGPHAANATSRLPATAHMSIRLDQALGLQPLTTLKLQPGDSVRVLVSLMEGEKVERPAEDAAATASVGVLAAPAAERAASLQRALSALTGRGDHWLGSATLLVTNEGGRTYWRAIDCLATCAVINRPASTEIVAAPGAPIAGVLELTGAGATYHMQLNGLRTAH